MKILENPTKKPDLILIDITLPEMSGIEMCRMIKATNGFRDIPIIMLAGEAREENLKRAFAVGAVDYIRKPVRQVELLARVRSLLKLKQETDERKLREKQISQSLRYAKNIQVSLLPNLEDIKSFLPDSFFIWIPRSVVSGDIYYVDLFDDGCVIAVIDCTGHGVPGGFMTMIASSGLKRIINDEGCLDPGKILKRLNYIVKTTLKQNTASSLSDDGLDAAICLIKPEEKKVIFAGAMMPLHMVKGGKTSAIAGDRKSIGYKRSDLDFDFTNHTICLEQGMSFYITSDGFTDQLGGERNRKFGKKRFRNLLADIHDKPFTEQQRILIDELDKFRGDQPRLDDVTVVGFGSNFGIFFDNYL